MLSEHDRATLAKKGISEEKLNQQLKRFTTGFPYMRLASSAKVGAGIKALDDDEQEKAIARWHKYLEDGGEVIKMVPASGAASRMFKALFSFVEGEDAQPKEGSPVDQLLKGIDRTPFREELEATMLRLHGLTIKEALQKGRAKDVIAALILPEGMGYGSLPKGLLLFHRYQGHLPRTPLEEQMAEGAQMAKGRDGVVKLHFTVSPDHRKLFTAKIEQVKPEMEVRFGVKYDITLSEQKPSTDTVAGAEDGSAFRDEKGEMVFRPGGHGALIENLNDLDSAVVFLKNIDNVVPDSRRDDTIRYKEVLGGYLVQVHDQIAQYLGMLNTGKYTIDDLREMIAFLHDVLCIRDEKMKSLEDAELALYIKSKLDRPLRVCGMVKNEGEPGGGPFIAYNPDGSTSPQILESTQIDPANPEDMAMMREATHFNPVDLVCYIKDVNGKKYDLPSHVDPDAGFISSKSYHGRKLKALELPGLWNGAMSDWNTVFVEVPITTFNPVKTVNDLLRPVHNA
ncbi:MAG: DUF4301 family protein [Bacteroidales bacterium]|nr:DUF4301 family protein [Bacteroidales bacterium]